MTNFLTQLDPLWPATHQAFVLGLVSGLSIGTLTIAALFMGEKIKFN